MLLLFVLIGLIAINSPGDFRCFLGALTVQIVEIATSYCKLLNVTRERESQGLHNRLYLATKGNKMLAWMALNLPLFNFIYLGILDLDNNDLREHTSAILKL